MATNANSPNGASSPLRMYDGLFWGEVMIGGEAQDLRTLARVFDLNAGPEIELADLWRRLRPLVAKPPGC